MCLSKVLKVGAEPLLPPQPWALRGTAQPAAPSAVALVPPPAAAPLLAREATAASAEAEATLVTARLEAERLLAEAEAAAAAVERSAWETGPAEGLAAGRREADAAAAESLRAAMLEVEGMRRKVEAERDNLVASAQNELLALAVTLARRIVVAELSLRPEIIVDMVAEALQQLRPGADPAVHAHPEDAERLAEPGLSPRRRHLAGSVAVVADTAVEPGEFVIKSRHGQIEGKRKREFAELVAFLQEAGEGRPWP